MPNTLSVRNLNGETLIAEEATLYRALAARANYLALDRPDLAFSSKEPCRDFASPTKLSVEKLKILVRYVVRPPRLIWRFNFSDANANDADHDLLRCFVDTDFAGCLTTRRSTSGGGGNTPWTTSHPGLVHNPGNGRFVFG